MGFPHPCRFLTALGAAAWLGGCATPMTEAECRAADWYQIGHADGDIYGIRPRIDQLAYQCQAFGVQAQEPIYIAGWVDGYREYLIRMNGSECCGSH